VDADLRSGHRLETVRRSESIIYLRYILQWKFVRKVKVKLFVEERFVLNHIDKILQNIEPD